MQNGRPQDVKTTAVDKRDTTPSAILRRVNTGSAGVLADMLNVNSATGIDAVFKQSTTGVAAVVHSLETNDECAIERRNAMASTNDDRPASIKIYRVPAVVREAAFANDALVWVNDVRAAAATRRNAASNAKVIAAKLNAMRIAPRQRGLFGGLV